MPSVQSRWHSRLVHNERAKSENNDILAVATKLEVLEEKGTIKAADVAQMLDVRPETVSRWRQGKAYPHSRTENQLLELEYLVDQLSDLYTPNEARQWFFSRQRLLGEKPAELIKQGKIDELLAHFGAVKRDRPFVIRNSFLALHEPNLLDYLTARPREILDTEV